DFLGDGPFLAPQGDRVSVYRQAVKLGTEPASKAFELVERRGLLEGSSVELDRRMRRIDARTAARRLFRAARVRRAVGAEKKLRIARDRRFDQRLAMCLALKHGQAVVVWPDAAEKERVAVQEQMMCGDG